jgi:hypothetical protein
MVAAREYSSREGRWLCSWDAHFRSGMAEPVQLLFAPAACDFASERMSFSRIHVL